MHRLAMLMMVSVLALGTTGAFAQPLPRYGPAAPPAQEGPAAALDSTLGQCFTAILEGSQQVPAVNTPASGVGTFVMSPDKISFTYYITYTGLTSTETMAHFHKAVKGSNGGVVYALSSTAPKMSSQSLTSTDAADIEAGRWYVNIHTQNFPNGEIRGQIVPGSNCFAASLNGAAETPPVDTAAKGAGTFALAPDRTLVYDINFSGMTERTLNGSHIHKGALGISGAVVHALQAGTAKRGTVTLSSEQEADLRNGDYYVNIHSDNFPNGEIRGQIFPASNCFGVTLSGRNEIPQNSSAASGRGGFWLTTTLSGTQTINNLYYMIYSTGIMTPTAQHIHRGGALVNGAVVAPLVAGEPKFGTVQLSADDLALLRGGMLYTNLHSETYPNGEIRGQMVPTMCKVNVSMVLR